MKTKFKLLVAVAALVSGAGCASEKGSPAPPATVTCTDASCTTIATPTPSPTPTSYYSGSSASLMLTSTSELAKLFYNSNPNSPTNVQVNIDLSRSSDTVIVSYQDGGVTHEAAFGSVHPTNGSVSNTMYNGWVNQSGKQIWKGFFQDKYGAIVLIVDKYISQGDGQSGNILGGSIWFQNFNRYYPNNPTQGPLKMCWEITMGPYDCRTFIIGMNPADPSNYPGMVSVTSSYNPNNHGPDANMNYEKLGDFNGISKSAAGF